MLKFGKNQVKVISIAIAAVFVLSIIGLAIAQSGKSYAAGSSGNSNIGVVVYRDILKDMPEVNQAQDQMKTEFDNAKKEFETKSKGMNDQQKQQLQATMQQQLAAKEQELQKPVIEKANSAIKAVAEAKGISVVMDKSAVLYGGQDITEEVAKKLAGK